MRSLTVPPVSTIALPGIAGRLLLSPCPGRWSTPAGSEREASAALIDDLAHIVTLGAYGMVSLVEAPELPGGRVQFAAAVERAGLRWAHLPIRDFGIPDDNFALSWQRLDLLGRLRAGESWAMHCRAGLGRTGTMAAQLLVEAGQAPADAIATIRRQHAAEAVETAAQAQYLMSLPPRMAG
ncbi:protein tyrosine phosphatase [Bosea sp. WAO]|uniref:phosphatase domain-containing protein n=1 Tax=Bosea sp. WAO TaxID=406341 RepID=UPI0012EDFDBA|nr:protein tyrosine phosphatase [Bosea sp. WAO]